MSGGVKAPSDMLRSS